MMVMLLMMPFLQHVLKAHLTMSAHQLSPLQLIQADAMTEL